MNTQTQEALHKALKVLNCLNNDRVYETAWVKGAINACEEALAQPAQEPVLYIDQGGLDGHATWAQPNACQNTDIPLYTHPAPSWQGLSDDDMSIIFDKFDWKEVEIVGEYLDLFKFAHAIEQALKEKNGR